MVTFIFKIKISTDISYTHRKVRKNNFEKHRYNSIRKLINSIPI